MKERDRVSGSGEKGGCQIPSEKKEKKEAFLSLLFFLFSF
jgi:hypothetical protein